MSADHITSVLRFAAIGFRSFENVTRYTRVKYREMFCLRFLRRLDRICGVYFTSIVPDSRTFLGGEPPPTTPGLGGARILIPSPLNDHGARLIQLLNGAAL